MKRNIALVIVAAAITSMGTAQATTPVHMCFGKPATIVGTPGNDILQGTDGPDVIVGLAGSDFIWGHDGRDLICGGRGDDGSYSPSNGVGELDGGRGADKISGGRGNDELNGGFFQLPSGDSGRGDVLVGNEGDDHLCDNACYQNSFQTTDSGDDLMRGGSGNDILSSTGGDDHQSGGSGRDLLGQQLFACVTTCMETQSVDSGRDHYFGRSGDDTIKASDGVRGNDSVDGGPDTDACWTDPGDRRINCET